MEFSITEEVKKQGALLGVLGAVGGFISDVLQPLAPLSFYVFVISIIASGLLIFSIVILKSRRRKLFHAFLLTAAFALFSGIFVGLNSDETQAKGVLASNVPLVEKLQSTLGLIQKDIAEIKETTKRTAQAVEKIEKTSKETAQLTKQVVDNTQKIATSLDAIQKGFSKLSSAGGIIADPKQPQEFYHNARIYELRGDYLNARKSYNRLFTFKLNVIDPHLRYQTFLKVQEGRAGAREVYAALYELDQRPIVKFAHITLFNAPQRLAMLKTFIEANKEFAPAYYELSREYSLARKGVQSRKDKQEELKALEAFMALHQQGKLLKYFIDKQVATKWIKDAETRLKALAALKRTAGNSPVRINASRHGSGWNISLLMQETPKDISYKLGEEGAFKTTGMTQNTNQATGFPIPQMYFQLPAKTPATSIYIKYTDVGGEVQGPFKLTFDPMTELYKSQKKILGLTRNSWISYRDFDGRLLVYFTHLVSYRCSIAEVKYSIGSQDLDKTFPLAPCDAAKPFTVPSDARTYIDAPRDTKSLTVELTYKDGTKSEKKVFDR